METDQPIINEKYVTKKTECKFFIRIFYFDLKEKNIAKNHP